MPKPSTARKTSPPSAPSIDEAADKPADQPADKPADKRLLRGARSRTLVLARAVDIASLESVEGLSFGRLAADTGMSKAGIQALFDTKQALQKETIVFALRLFRDFVVLPAETQPPGVPRFRALIGGWLDYAEKPLFAGGCFFAANLTHLDSHPGELRDLVAGAQRAWIARLSDELKHAVAQGAIDDPDPDFSAFKIEAVLCSANTAMRLGEVGVTRKVWRVVEGVLADVGK